MNRHKAQGPITDWMRLAIRAQAQRALAIARKDHTRAKAFDAILADALAKHRAESNPASRWHRASRQVIAVPQRTTVP